MTKWRKKLKKVFVCSFFFYIQLVIQIMYTVKLDGALEVHIQYWEGNDPFKYERLRFIIIWRFLLGPKTSIQYLVKEGAHRVYNLTLLVHLALVKFTNNTWLVRRGTDFESLIWMAFLISNSCVDYLADFLSKNFVIRLVLLSTLAGLCLPIVDFGFLPDRTAGGAHLAETCGVFELVLLY